MLTVRQIARETAQLAKKSRKKIKVSYLKESENGPIHKLLKLFNENYNLDTEIDYFIDSYLQTIVCILFTLRVDQKKNFSFEKLSSISFSNPIFVNLFYNSIKDILKELGINAMIDFLKMSNIEATLAAYKKTSPEIDITSYFYELFIRAFDSQQQNIRGIFHTPNPIVDFIVRSIDYLLRMEFNCPEGLSTIGVPIFDPATGTGTFLGHTITQIKLIFDKNHEKLTEGELKIKWNEYISNHLLQKIFGLELLMAPYSIAHLKIEQLLKETGFDFSENQHLCLFLKNALESSLEDIFSQDITLSSQIPVIIGNPPYARSSKNTSAYIETLMDSYKQAVRDEKNIQPLSDDYIKFIRLAQDLIERVGCGIIGLITNHTYLNGIIHRGMREELMNAFDRIYVLDLHGSKIIHEKVPVGIKDENIFTIKQGVCIIFLVKKLKTTSKEIYHFDLFGTKREKFEWLKKNDISTISYVNLSNIKPGAPFMNPSDIPVDSEYHTFHSLTDLFEFCNVGGKPGDDNLLISFEPHEVENKLKFFIEKIKREKFIGRKTEAITKLIHHLDKFSIDPLKIERYNYRPLDIRWTYYDPSIWTRPVKELKAYCQNTPMLLCSRIVKDKQFSHTFISNLFTDVIFLSNTSSVNCYVFPLLKRHLNGELSWNLAPSYLNYLKNMGLDVQNLDSVEPLAYIYAILFSNKYRSQYSEFLKRDFPQIPFIKNQIQFTQLVELGNELINLHLYPEKLEAHPNIKTNIVKNDKIAKGFPKFNKGYVFIDSNKWFYGITDEEWKFRIGKYQVCQKWLKDRRTRFLSAEDISCYLRIIRLIKETIRLINEIDTVINILEWASIRNVKENL